MHHEKTSLARARRQSPHDAGSAVWRGEDGLSCRCRARRSSSDFRELGQCERLGQAAATEQVARVVKAMTSASNCQSKVQRRC
jgi:hypothetical protein